jgi:hypothetical protein
MEGEISSPNRSRGTPMIRFGEIAGVPFLCSRIDRNRCSRWRTAFLGFVFVMGSCGAPGMRAGDLGFGCVDRMTLPVYGGLVWQGQITGTATARIAVNLQGRSSDVKVESPHEALTLWIAGAIRRTSFRRECNGRTIELIFKYKLEGPPRAAPDNQIVFRYPGGLRHFHLFCVRLSTD